MDTPSQFRRLKTWVRCWSDSGLMLPFFMLLYIKYGCIRLPLDLRLDFYSFQKQKGIRPPSNYILHLWVALDHHRTTSNLHLQLLHISIADWHWACIRPPSGLHP
uniref:Uncharacterized protein n=1 Tax=Cannabis sativa TaxID=3483 RepID=A0A803R949_CANSA